MSWTGTTNDLNLYMYDPSGALVAKSEQRSTTSETVTYNAPTAGYYLIKVQAKTAFRPVTFTGESSKPVKAAYVKTGTLGRGQTVSMNVNPGNAGSVNARLTCGWSFSMPTMSLLWPERQQGGGRQYHQGELDVHLHTPELRAGASGYLHAEDRRHEGEHHLEL